MRSKTRTGRTGTLGRSRPWVLMALLCLASAHLPVVSSAQRFGKQPSQKTRSCPTEQTSSGFAVTTVQRDPNVLEDEIARTQQNPPDPSVQAISPVAESRLALQDRRPEYLKSFVSSSSHNFLSPPEAR